ncbi:MAG: 30S ribosomal protein S6 [Desulfarculales bacterium]|jgi:small subunit ribosomal protein S6|nr:30S ribosomal protein S6 [Desulfarculales bacterium]
MRHYETLFVVNPDLSEEDTALLIEKFSAVLSSGGANILKTDLWGRRRLAYAIRKFTKGYYVILEYGANPEAVLEMERLFRIDEKVLRFLTVKKGDEFDPQALALAEAKAKERAAARAARQSSADDDEEDGDEFGGKDDYEEDEA